VFVLVVLVAAYGVLVLLELVGLRPAALRSQRAKLQIALAAMFLLASSTRLLSPTTLLAMIPARLPWRREALYVSGVFEALGALGLLAPATRRPAGLGLALLLLLVFPANVNVAVNNLQIEGYPSSPLYQWARLPIQALLIWLVLWASRATDTSVVRPPAASSPSSGSTG
jgi:uncharacterized membrane protein